MPTEGERLAALEVTVNEQGKDIASLSAQVERSRTRLHNLEGFAQGVLDIQRENRRKEEVQYRRVANAIAIGGLAMAFGMLILTAITVYFHVS